MISRFKWPYPQWIAHRGGGNSAPENTLAGFRAGYQAGFRMFECDVKLSADGTLFLLHDDTLNRTTNGCGRADRYPYGELARFDAGCWFNELYAGEPVPNLENIARFVQQNQCLINLEIKPVPGRAAETGAALALDVRELWQHSDIPPLLSSFSVDALAAAAQVAPEFPRALLVDELPENWLALLQETDSVALDINHTRLTEEMVGDIKLQGYNILCYTVNSAARADQLLSWGVASVITDVMTLLPA